MPYSPRRGKGLNMIHAVPEDKEDDGHLRADVNGIRGVVNETLTPPIILALGQAAAQEFRKKGGESTLLLGKVPERESYTVEMLLTGAFTACGWKVLQTGPLPTAGVAVMTRSMRADLGIMITASDRYGLSGVKIFGPDGAPILPKIEQKIFAETLSGDFTPVLVPRNETGRVIAADDVRTGYIEFLKGRLPSHLNLDGLRVVVDCAHGAAYKTAPQALEQLGAEVFAVNVAPDGFNINRQCGPLFPEVLKEQVYYYRADLGIALDGDADRVLLMDSKRRVVETRIVRSVIEMFGNRPYGANPEHESWTEQIGEGQIVMPLIVNTSDGLLTALQVLAAMAKAKHSLSTIVDTCSQ